MRSTTSVKMKVAAIVIACVHHAGPVQGQSVDPPQKPEWTLYEGQGVDANLLGIPRGLLTNRLKRESSHFIGVGYGKPASLPAWMTDALGRLGLAEPSGAVEVIAVQHRGLQHNFEADVAFILRTGFAHFGPVRVRGGAGIGLSYAFGRPSYEDGPAGDPTRRYRFQNYDAFEVEGGVARLPNTSLVARIHHRSGLYGLIAPRQVGSNFLTVGIRHRF